MSIRRRRGGCSDGRRPVDLGRPWRRSPRRAARPSAPSDRSRQVRAGGDEVRESADAPSAALANAIRAVHTGGRALTRPRLRCQRLRVSPPGRAYWRARIDPDFAAQAWSEPAPLTDRRWQAARLVGEGRSGPETAAALRLSGGTVPQLPVRGDLPTGGADPGRGGAPRPHEGMALMRALYARTRPGRGSISRLGARNRVEAARLARTKGWL